MCYGPLHGTFEQPGNTAGLDKYPSTESIFESSIGWTFGTYTFSLFVGGAQYGKKSLCSYILVEDMFIIVSGATLDSHGRLYVILPRSVENGTFVDISEFQSR